MKKIEAIIKPFKLENVKSALAKAGVHSITIQEVRGYESSGNYKEHFRGTEYKIEFVPKVHLTVYTEASQCKSLIKIIETEARTENEGDGRIVVSTVDEIIRIRTGETGVEAIQKDDS